MANFFPIFFLFFGHRNKQQQPVQHTSDNQLEWLITNYLAEFFLVQWLGQYNEKKKNFGYRYSETVVQIRQ